MGWSSLEAIVTDDPLSDDSPTRIPHPWQYLDAPISANPQFVQKRMCVP
jgi:hypothetical protein